MTRAPFVAMTVVLLAGCAASPKTPADTRCAQVQQYATELSDKMDRTRSSKEDAPDPKAQVYGTSLQTFANVLVANNPQCFSPEQVADAQTYLDRLQSSQRG